MVRIIGVTELQRRFRAVFEEVAKGGTSYVLTRGSRPEVVLIPYEMYLKFEQFQEKEILNRFDRLTGHMARRSAEYSDNEVESDIRAARRKRRRR